MRRHLATALVLWAISAPCLFAAGISISFHGGDNQNPAQGASLNGAEAAGAFYYNLGNWNNVPDATGAPNPFPALMSGTATNLRDNFGAATPASVTWLANNTWDINTARDNANRRMIHGYLDTNDTSTTGVGIDNIPYANYEVVVYFDGDNGGTSRVGKYTLTDSASNVRTIYGRDGASQNFNATFLQSYSATDPGAPNPPNNPTLHNQVPAGNFVVFRNLTGPSVVLEATGGSTSAATSPTPAGSPRAPINAIQIVETVPNPVFFGPNQQGGFNAYEIRLDQATQAAAINMASTLTFPGSGAYGVPANATQGHSASILSADENNFLRTRILSNAWIGLTDSATYGGNDDFATARNTSGSPLPAAGVAPVAGERGFGFVWGRGPGVAPTEALTYQNWNGGEPNDSGANIGEDAIELIAGSGLWNDNRNGEGPQVGQTRIWITEYDLNLSALPTLLPLPTPGPPPPSGVRGTFQVTTARGYTGGNGQMGHTQQADAFIRSGLGTVTHSQTHVINHADPQAANVGRFGGNITFDQDTGADDNDFAMVAKGRIIVSNDQAGLWTFGVDSDDGFRLRIPGQNFISTTSIGTLGTHIQGDTLEMPYPRGGANALSLGVINLPAGEHDVELLFFERAGGGGVELMAAPGAQTQFGNITGTTASTFRLVGYRGTGAVTTAQAPAEIVGGSFNIREVRRVPNSAAGDQLNNLAQTTAALNTPRATDIVMDYTAAMVNHNDPDNSGTGIFHSDAAFRTNVGGDTNDIAFRATATLRIATPGDYTFGFNGDDGGQLTFLDPDGPGGPLTAPAFTGFNRLGDQNAAHTVGINGGSLFYDSNTGNSHLIGQINLAAGDYPIEFLYWERGGGALVELFGAVGHKTAMDGTFLILGAPSVTVVDSDGLQLVPEPSTWAIAGLGLVALAFVRRRRSR
jgi:hypothetical protein